MTTIEARVVSAASGVADIELGVPLPALIAVPPLGVRCLVRAGGAPIGVVDVAGPADRIDAEAVAALLWAGLEPAIAPLIDAAPRALTATGIAGLATARRAADPQITVAIATRDRPSTLHRCIESVLAAEPGPAAVVVVDNAPSDERTRDLVAEVYGADPRITYVVEHRPGLGRAHNAALAHVTTEHVAFTDDDVVVDPGWIGALGDAFAATPDVACVSGLIAPAELRTREQWWVERSAGFGKGFERRVRSLRTAEGEGPLFPYDAGTFGSGANMAFTMAFLHELGGFDPALGTGTASLGGDDLAALHLAVASGHDLVYEPSAIVFHRHHDRLPALERQARGYGAGLTAYLTSLVVHDPREALRILRRVGPGLGRLLRPTSPLNERRDPSYPRSLVWRERAGMASGPGRYLQQRWRDRRTDRTPS